MDRSEWESVQRHSYTIQGYITDTKELVHYLIEEIQDNYSLESELEIKEIAELQSTKSILEYLRRRMGGFDLLCAALEGSMQGFIVTKLKRTRDSIPDVDSTLPYIPESRGGIFQQVTTKLQSGRSYINLWGERGVGTSAFLEQICKHLRESCYFTVYKMDLTDTPLVLQQKHFRRIKHGIAAKEHAMKRYIVFCVDNYNASGLENLPEARRAHQEEFFSSWIRSCRKDLEISFLSTSSEPIEGLGNIEISRLGVSEMARDIQHMFPKITDLQLRDLTSIFPNKCNPLDCFLIATLYVLHNRQIAHLATFLAPNTDHDQLFTAVFTALPRTQQDILLALYALPCNGKVGLPSVYSLFHGTSRPPDEDQILELESDVARLVQLNLINRLEDGRFCMKDSNFFYHFRRYFGARLRKRFRVYYLRALHHYLDYTISFIQDIHSLSDSNKVREEEWIGTIPCITLVLDPSDREVELALLAKPNLSRNVYVKRLFVMEKLRSLVLHIPNETLILAAKTILDDFKQYHSKYAQFEDKAKLLCLITELSLTPDCRSVDARDNLSKALTEVMRLLGKSGVNKTALRTKYYMRILNPLGEIYLRENRLEDAQHCFKECLKLPCESKTIRWMLKRRLHKIGELMRENPPSGGLDSGPLAVSPVSISSPHFLSNDIKFHLEMGDSFYVRGELPIAFKYYFELWKKFHSRHMMVREQEYILCNLGHLKMQKRKRLNRENVLAAIQFYAESNEFYKLRKDAGRDSEFLKICLVTSNLLAGKRGAARDLHREMQNAQPHTHTQFFVSITHREANSSRFLWKELTYTEKQHFTNKIQPAVVNYYMLENHHYKMKLDYLRTNDPATFLEFPSPSMSDNLLLFDINSLYKQNVLHLTVYIKIPSTRI